jgi:uncharacterized protein
MKRISSLVFLSVILIAFSAAIAADVPYLTGRVTDNAGILSAHARKALSENLKAHEARTGNQIAVLTIPTLHGEAIEEYAVRVFEEWKLGQKGKDNGVLMIVVPEDRRMRIEVGYGLEGTLTDLMAGRIIQHVMTPRFGNGDYEGGLTDGVMAVVKLLERGEAPAVTGGTSRVGRSGANFVEPDLPILQRILFGAFIFGIIGLFTVIGILTPGVGWFLYLFLIPFWAMFPIVVLGVRGALICLAGYLVVFPVAKLLLKNSEWHKKAVMSLRTKGGASIGSFTFSSGGGGGFSRSSSGFSGGGGSSGGGGASGSW